jgi:flagellar L-ring protein precursor FlgH
MKAMTLVGIAAAVIASAWGTDARAQSTSLAKRLDGSGTEVQFSRETLEYSGNPALENRSLIAVRVKPPKKFRIEDLITIIVRQQTTYESGGQLQNNKNLRLESELEAFVKFIDGGIGAAEFSRGRPDVDYELKSKFSNRADKDREDRLTTRITARIIDVKPNGNLVLEAEAAQQFDDEVNIMSLTGVCRSIDVTPDNTVLSTQIADLGVKVKNTGAIRDGSARGWLHRFIDVTKPW